MAAGHHSTKCRRARKCGVDGCQNDHHSSYLHESTSQHGTSNVGPQLSPEVSANNSNPQTDSSTQERTHKTSKADNVSLMVLPAIVSNGQKELKVNAMLDPCLTSSYISENAAGELELRGQPLNLTIAGTGGTEVQKCSRLVDLTVSSLNGASSAPLQAHVLDNIASNTPAFEWARLKDKWPHLREVPFKSVSR